MQKERLMELAGVQLNETEEPIQEVTRLMKELAKRWIPEDDADYEKHKYAIKAMAQEIVDAIK